jgi:PEP-CTERM motif
MKNTLRMLLLAFGFAVLGSSVHADEISTFDAAIRADLPALDQVFAAYPNLNLLNGLNTSAPQWRVGVDCLLTDPICNSRAIVTQSEFEEALFPSIFPGCITDSSSCDDQNVFNGNMIQYTFDVEADDLPSNSVPEPNTLLLISTGLLPLVWRMRKR